MLRKNHPEPRPRAALRPTRPRTQHDARQLRIRRASLRQIKVAHHPRPIAPDGHRALLDIRRQFAPAFRFARRRRLAVGRCRGLGVARRLTLRRMFRKVVRHLLQRADAVLVRVDEIEQLRHLLASDFPVAIAVELLEPIGRGGVLRYCEHAKGKGENECCGCFHWVGCFQRARRSSLSLRYSSRCAGVRLR